MKKAAKYCVVTLIAALMLYSCVQPLDPDLTIKASGKNNLELKVSCQSPSTKAFENYPAGETTLNENKIEHIDWFIFRDTTAGVAWQSDRVTFSDKADGTSEFSVKTLDMDQYKTLYSDGKGYVLTVANYPAEEGHDVFNNLTFAQIREMEVVTEELGNLAYGKFTALNSFVMTSYATPFTLAEDTPVTVNAKLVRLAAKISLNINIVPYIDEIKAYVSGIDTTRIEYVQTWYPDVQGIRAYLAYANKHTTMSPVDTSMRDAESYNDNDFFTYDSRGFVLDTPIPTTSTGDSIVTGTPFYSYPMKWETSDSHAPFIKIILRWEGRYENNTVIPGGGKYITHTTGGTHAGDTVVVNSHNRTGTIKSTSQNFYYKVSLPSTHKILHSNVWTKINLDVAVLGGVDEEQTVDVIGRYYVVDWSNPGVAAGGELTAGKYLSLSTARNTFYMYGIDSLQIPVKSSHALNYTIVSREAYVGGDWVENPKKADGTAINISSRGGARFAPDGRSYIKFGNQLNTTIDDDLDCYPLRFTVEIRHAENTGTTPQTITIYQYPSIYVSSIPGGNCFVNGFYGHLNINGAGTYYYRGTTESTGGNATTTDHGASGTGGNVRVSYGNMTRATTDEQNLVIISVSAFSDDSKNYTVSGTGAGTYPYVIADPRTNTITSTSLRDYNTNYTNTGDNTTVAWPSADIKVGSTETGSPNTTPGRNFIAPKFMISSTWGRNPGMGSNITFEMAQRRCATYQEAGYPAGRWRLPTEAEAAFITVLQYYDFISTMFSDNTAYALSNSRGVSVNGASASIGTTFRSLRCVYDLWYWGDEPFTDTPWTYVIAPGNTKLNN